MSERLPGALRAASGFGIPFLLVLYLAFASGGYDLVSRSQVGLIVWWAILLGILIGVLPAARVTTAGPDHARGGGSAAALDRGRHADLDREHRAERHRTEPGGDSVRRLRPAGPDPGERTVCGTRSARSPPRSRSFPPVALLDRFHPDLLPFGTDYVFPEGYPRARLNYPLEYWNGLAIFIAMGVGPLLWIVASGRTVAGRAVAAGALPILALAGYLTASRGGVIEGAVVLLVMLVLFPKRLLLLLNLLIPAAGAILLVVLVNRRPELRDLAPGNLTETQGSQMTWLTLPSSLLAAGAQAGAILVAERLGLKLPEASRNLARGIGHRRGHRCRPGRRRGAGQRFRLRQVVGVQGAFDFRPRSTASAT